MTSRMVMTIAAVMLLESGLALLFAPSEIMPGVPPFFTQLFASSLLSLGVIDWFGRSMTIGGIYGRSMTVGNLVAFGVAAMSGLRATFGHPTIPSSLVTAIAFVFAACFARLLTKRE